MDRTSIDYSIVWATRGEGTLPLANPRFPWRYECQNKSVRFKEMILTFFPLNSNFAGDKLNMSIGCCGSIVGLDRSVDRGWQGS